MRVHNRVPTEVLTAAHLRYPAEVGKRGLYGVAFFGHSRPTGLGHRETCESIWRGVVRSELKAACEREQVRP